MSGHRPFSELIKDWPEERLQKIKLGSARLNVKVEIARVIGEELLRQNDALSDLLCEAELDFSDKELLQAIADQVDAVAGRERAFTSAQLDRLRVLTDEVRGWIALAESIKV